MAIAVSLWPIIWIGIVVGVIVAIFCSELRGRQRRKEHVATREYTSDAAFLEELNVDVAQYDLCLSIRQTAAKIMKVPVESVQVSESDKHLSKMGITFEEFLLVLGHMLHMAVDFPAAHKLAYSNKKSGLSCYGGTFGELIRFVLDHPSLFKKPAGSRDGL